MFYPIPIDISIFWNDKYIFRANKGRKLIPDHYRGYNLECVVRKK